MSTHGKKVCVSFYFEQDELVYLSGIAEMKKCTVSKVIREMFNDGYNLNTGKYTKRNELSSIGLLHNNREKSTF
jgi:hypothetical protein